MSRDDKHLCSNTTEMWEIAHSSWRIEFQWYYLFISLFCFSLEKYSFSCLFFESLWCFFVISTLRTVLSTRTPQLQYSLKYTLFSFIKISFIFSFILFPFLQIITFTYTLSNVQIYHLSFSFSFVWILTSSVEGVWRVEVESGGHLFCACVEFSFLFFFFRFMFTTGDVWESTFLIFYFSQKRWQQSA